MAAARASATQLLVCAAQLRETCTDVAAQYRLFFCWLLRTVQRLKEDASAGPTDVGGPIDTAGVARFLQGQYHVDALGRELQVPLCRLTAPHRSTVTQ